MNAEAAGHALLREERRLRPGVRSVVPDRRQPRDFAAEDYETTWAGRATPADLNDTGRKQLGLQPW
jgi:hypothetical protein